jgi:hypothetical protein
LNRIWIHFLVMAGTSPGMTNSDALGCIAFLIEEPTHR